MFEDIKESLFGSKEEKKVEYIELIYDLIFVYIIGRNSNLIHHIENGFISPDLFLTYILCTLIAIQIWNYTNFYINRYGSNGLKEHLLMLVNMYLLYFMADGTRIAWQEYYPRYNVAWSLILINIGVHYFLKLKETENTRPWEIFQIKLQILLMGSQALIVLVSIPIFLKTGLPISPFALVYGIIYTLVIHRVNSLVPVDFAHLAERAMLYVVFTFGEMIIAVSGYFQGDFGFNTIYFSLMGFLIVVGLFQSYEIFYDHLLDREILTSGTPYMMIHIFLIFSLSTITASLEFMREEEVDLLPKMLFLTVSFIIYYIFLYLLVFFTKAKARPKKKFMIIQISMLIIFGILMILLREYMYINIALTVLLVIGNLYVIARAKKEYYIACKGCK